MLFSGRTFDFNCSKDIAGANGVGWPSILVETGVYNRSDGLPPHTPSIIKPDVERAVEWALEQELWKLQ